MQLFDSSQKALLPFQPIQPGQVRIYVCGPTVYDDAHLGHARSAIVFDLLRRTLTAMGYRVTFVKNFTDIDDKIIKKVQESGRSLQELTQDYIQRYKEDMAALGVLPADLEPRATESLDAIFQLIQALLDRGIAYRTPQGDIYFDTSKDRDYCTLSHRCDEERLHRIEPDPHKRNPADFALWKACKGAEDICFDSPFGPGRPGWHIECSAMIDKYLAYHESPYQIDIHGGGADLLFPHHENESAQTRCACGQKLARYWLHNGFVTISGEKMSKSLGNSFFVKDALQIYDGEILRFYLLSTHYRLDLNFNEEDLLATKRRLDRLYRLKKRLYGIKPTQVEPSFKEAMLHALGDDLNISKALAVMDGFIKEANERLDQNPKDRGMKRKFAANIAFLGELLGIGTKDPFHYFQLGVDEETRAKVEALIEERHQAKQAKDFQRADAIRDHLAKMGIALMDTPQGTFWERI
ncbi:MAG: cysteine--tRNA ligase [Nitratiruptor sp.]|nr:cysteine--tRNA ligase [Nitratiruptor sp.]NPA83215.1 cysteine--tRNA ligase [Campylobacterota bacterium]